MSQAKQETHMLRVGVVSFCHNACNFAGLEWAWFFSRGQTNLRWEVSIESLIQVIVS